MLTQHEKRRNVIFMLYISEFYEKDEIDEALDNFLEYSLFADEDTDAEKIKSVLNDKEQKNQLLSRYNDIKEKIGVIDPMIASVSKGWKLGRMGRIDLQIMRMAVFEIFYDDEVPSSVAINEAVKLASAYGGDEGSPAFINGILGRLWREKNKNEEE